MNDPGEETKQKLEQEELEVQTYIYLPDTIYESGKTAGWHMIL